MAAPTAPPLASAHDLDLVALATAGGRAAFSELMRRHASAVRGLLRRMGADPSLADDLAQDAFLAAFERIAEFRGEGAFAGWVKRIAARLYLRRWRGAARDRALARAVADDADADLGATAGKSASADRLDLDEALKTLSAAERLCVSLCYGAGLSHAEAAAALKSPVGTVKSHVKRGLDKLRVRLGGDGGATESQAHG